MTAVMLAVFNKSGSFDAAVLEHSKIWL